MSKVFDLVQTLSPKHREAVRENLASDQAFSKYSLLILEAYEKGQGNEPTQNALNLKPIPFKVFERSIFRSILSFYQMEDISVKDLIDTSIFYSLYGSNQKSAKEHSKELELLFHSMKQFGIEQESEELLNALHQLNIGTPLEAVYAHLAEKYQGMAAKNKEILNIFQELNGGLQSYLLEDFNETSLKASISSYKKIRSIYQDNKNGTSNTIYCLSKLMLVVFANQKQLLFDGGQELGELIKLVKKLIDEMPFGMDKFYLQNIFSHTYTKHLKNNGHNEVAQQIISKNKKTNLIEAWNFGFPNQVSEKFFQNEAAKIKSQASYPKNGVLISLPEKLGINISKNNQTIPRDYISFIQN